MKSLLLPLVCCLCACSSNNAFPPALSMNSLGHWLASSHTCARATQQQLSFHLPAARVTKLPHSPSPTILKGKRTTLEIQGSKTNLNFHWDLIAPPGALSPRLHGRNRIIRLTPRAVGPYRIRVETEGDACVFQELSWIVTDKSPLQVPSGPIESLPASGLGEGITIAFLDTGVHFDHPDLLNHVAWNRGEIPANQRDDDNNGFIDDVAGWDFIYQDNRPTDDEGHGTAMISLAVSRFGWASQARFLPLKVADAFGQSDIHLLIQAIEYAVDRKAQIINISLGLLPEQVSPHNLLRLREAIRSAYSNGSLVIVAAGNGDDRHRGMNLDEYPRYPACFNLPGLLTIGATEGTDVAPYSNYGPQSVALLAPGGASQGLGFLAAFRDNEKRLLYQRVRGTSVAASFVSALAARALSRGASIEEAQRLLTHTTDSHSSLKQWSRYGSITETTEVILHDARAL